MVQYNSMSIPALYLLLLDCSLNANRQLITETHVIKEGSQKSRTRNTNAVIRACVLRRAVSSRAFAGSLDCGACTEWLCQMTEIRCSC